MNKIISALVASTISTAPTYADQLKVVTDIPPVHGIVDAILGADANITSLISSGMDPHNFSMKPSHAAALSQADLVVFIGASLTPSLAEKLSSLAAGTKIIELEDIPNVHLIGYEDAHEEHDEDEHHEDHSNHDHYADHDEHNEDEDKHDERDHADGHVDKHTNERHDEDGHDGHDHSGIDAHMWLDLENAKIWANEIAKSATKLAPEMKSDISTNLASFERSLTDIETAVQTLTGKPYAVSHDAFGYLEETFGIDHPQAVTNGMGLRPSPSDMAKLRTKIEQTPPACMIIDPNDHTALAYALAKEYKIKTIEFSQIGEIVEGKNAYLNLMNNAVDAFRACFN